VHVPGAHRCDRAAFDEELEGKHAHEDSVGLEEAHGGLVPQQRMHLPG
jgi:hypothetical protein